jgi:hypothetical protein
MESQITSKGGDESKIKEIQQQIGEEGNKIFGPLRERFSLLDESSKDPIIRERMLELLRKEEEIDKVYYSKVYSPLLALDALATGIGITVTSFAAIIGDAPLAYAAITSMVAVQLGVLTTAFVATVLIRKI